MELKSQVCSLSQAKRLKELGVKQESLFYVADGEFAFYEKIIAEFEDGILNECADRKRSKECVASVRYSKSKLKEKAIELFESARKDKDTEIYSAFTAAELGVMLPPITEHLQRFVNWEWMGFRHGFDVIQFCGKFETEAEARAAMLIHLLESGTIKEVK